MNSVIINFYKFRNTRQANITENNIEDILNSIFVTSSLFIQGNRVHIFVIIFRRLRFVEPFGKVMRGKSQHRQRRISHALIHVEKYLLRIHEEQLKKEKGNERTMRIRLKISKR